MENGTTFHAQQNLPLIFFLTNENRKHQVNRVLKRKTQKPVRVMVNSPLSLLSLLACSVGLGLIGNGVWFAFQFLYLHQGLKSKHRRAFRSRLPSLAQLKRNMTRAIFVGVVVLGVAFTTLSARSLFRLSILALAIYSVLLVTAPLIILSQESRVRTVFYPGAILLFVVLNDFSRFLIKGWWIFFHH